MIHVTADELRGRFSYNPETGLILCQTSGAQAFCWTNGAGYKYGKLDSRAYYAHRIAWLHMQGEEVKIIDHIDGNKGNNAWCNLRSVTSAENSRNLSRSKANTSGCVGVTWSQVSKKWMAQGKLNGVYHYLGLFECKDEAIHARTVFNEMHGFTVRN